MQLQLRLGELGEVDDHEEVLDVGVDHALKLLVSHLGHRVDQIQQLSAHCVVRALCARKDALDILQENMSSLTISMCYLLFHISISGIDFVKGSCENASI